MTAFHRSYFEIAALSFEQLRMKRPEVVGRDSSWIYFPSPYAENPKVKLIHKFKLPAAELGIPTKNGQALADALTPLLPASMSVRVTKTWVFVAIPVPAIDHRQDFSLLVEAVRASLEALWSLRQFALEPSVRSVIHQVA